MIFAKKICIFAKIFVTLYDFFVKILNVAYKNDDY